MVRQVVSKAELSRLEKMSIHEKRLLSERYSRIAGIDEAGRGPIAGPVVAAACILPKDALIPHLNDSKVLTPEMREHLYVVITTHPETHFGIGVVDVETIDQVNILQATFFAMRQAVANLKVVPDYLLIDGNQIPTFAIPTLGIVKGDGHSITIAAASILAKVTRDRLMMEFDKRWPQYGFKKHKGYGTAEHVGKVREFGPCPLHRKSFEPVKSFTASLAANFPR